MPPGTIITEGKDGHENDLITHIPRKNCLPNSPRNTQHQAFQQVLDDIAPIPGRSTITDLLPLCQGPLVEEEDQFLPTAARIAPRV